jgi:hypothetical protein
MHAHSFANLSLSLFLRFKIFALLLDIYIGEDDAKVGNDYQCH